MKKAYLSIKQKAKRVYRFIRKQRGIILFILAVLLVPILLNLVYSCPLGKIPRMTISDCLSYYGTALGIFGGIYGSFLTYQRGKKKEQKSRLRELRPQLSVNLERIDEKKGLFALRIINHTEGTLSFFHLYDEYVSPILKAGETKFILHFAKQ